MKIDNVNNPPNLQKLIDIFGINYNKGIIVTYGDTIYCKYQLSPNKIAHESIHIKQQGNDPEAWWNKYYIDKQFRLTQELEAYKAELPIIKQVKDRNLRYKIIDKNARDLSSSMYGNIITYSQALKELKI